MVVAIIGIILMLAILPQLLQTLRLFKSDTKSDDQIKEDKLDEEARQEKGATCNSIDFLFGEGTCAELDKQANTGVLTGKTEEQLRIEILEENLQGEEFFGEGFMLGENTTLDSGTGIIESDTSPTFKLSAQDIADINESRIAQGLEPLGVQSDIISEVIETDATKQSFTGKRTRFGV